jgi:hypothetical protein
MRTDRRTARALGAAFLLQPVVSMAAHATESYLKQKLMVPGNMSSSLANIAANTWVLKANILGEILTALVIIVLGSLLFVTLRKHGEKLAVVGLGFFILAAGILATSRFGTYVLFRVCQASPSTHDPALMTTMGSMALAFMDFGPVVLGLPFALAEMLFCWLFYTSKTIPRALSLWGLVATFMVAAWSALLLCGYEVTLLIGVPYALFNLAVGLWALLKGVGEQPSAAETVAK